MKNIYIVRGFCGEYSDRSEWTVCAYESREGAEAHALAAQAAGNSVESRTDRDNFKNPHDDYFRTDYTGTEYHVEEVLLWEIGDVKDGGES